MTRSLGWPVVAALLLHVAILAIPLPTSVPVERVELALRMSAAIEKEAASEDANESENDEEHEEGNGESETVRARLSHKPARRQLNSATMTPGAEPPPVRRPSEVPAPSLTDSAVRHEPSPLPPSPTDNAVRKEPPRNRSLEIAYAQTVRRDIADHKRYPARAKRLRQRGRAVLSVRVARDGRLQGAPTLSEATGFPVLDQEAIDMAKRAAPFGVPPNGALTIKVPIHWQ